MSIKKCFPWRYRILPDFRYTHSPLSILSLFTITSPHHPYHKQGNARVKTYERACEVRDAYEKMAEGLEEKEEETKEERSERKRIKKVLIRSKKVSKLLKPAAAAAEQLITTEPENSNE